MARADLGAAVAAALNTRRLGRPLNFRASVGSSNDEARVLARAGAPEGTAVLADAQTAGRGRLGRGWQSPAGEGIWLSLVLRPALPAPETPRLTLAAAVAVAEAIRAHGVPAGIKWPNDILVDGRKCCGILTEMELLGEAVAFVILGIGLNVNQAGFPPEIAAQATSLRLALGQPLERVALACAILERLEVRYDQLLAGEAAAVLGAWRALSVTLGHRVRVTPATGGPALVGEAADVDADGALLLRRDDGRVERLLAGEVSLREASG